jgi:hypothetical protein
MDIVAHGLWAAAAAKGTKRKWRVNVRVAWAAWWGVFPDLFAFTLPLTVMLWYRFTDPAQAAAHAMPHRMPHLTLAWQLYQISHSLIIFLAVFGLVWLVARRPRYELLAWALHILMDIPTHTARFFPTPFLWPISSYRASGISWGNRWFMLFNYGALVLVYFLLWRSRRRDARSRELSTTLSNTRSG